MSEKTMKDIVAPLLAWYEIHQKDMPWRRDPTPYHVWISEIMLQQTRIEAAIPYYERFLSEVPDVYALASLEDDTLMKLWQGLGYYSRARNLKAAAEVICARYGGKLPRRASELKTLPGIGEYTAGAIASIAYGEPEPAVDGNVLRVIMRLQACEDDVMSPVTRRRVTEELRAIYPVGKEAGIFTQALMELGEVVCIPNGEPRCEECPVRAHCRARVLGRTADLPVRNAKKGRRQEARTVLLMRCDGRFAIAKRESKGLLAGLWEFPNVPGTLTPEQVRDRLAEWGITARLVTPCGEARHIFSHVEWNMTGYIVECENKTDAFVWCEPDEIRRQYAIPTAFRFYVNTLDNGKDKDKT